MGTLMILVVSMAVMGTIFGLVILNVMALVARNKGRPHDVTTFASDKDVMARVAEWAKANGYRLVREQGGSRLYQKGRNFLTAPIFLEVSGGPTYTFKSYVQVNGLLLKGDMALSGGGFFLTVPRSMAKKAQNQLFAELGHAGIP